MRKSAILISIAVGVLLPARAEAVPARLQVLTWDESPESMRIDRAVPTPSPDAAHDGPAGLTLAVTFAGNNRENAVLFPNRTLPGRAEKLVLWFRGDGRTWEIRARVHDCPNRNNQGTEGFDTPFVKVEQQGWQEVVLTLPGDGKGIENAGGTPGQIDYPLTLVELQIWEPSDSKLHSQPSEAQLAIDSVAVVTDVKPELAVGLAATPAPGKPRIPVQFRGVQIFDQGRSYRDVAWSTAAPVADDWGKPLVWRLSARNDLAAADAPACTFDLHYTVQDYADAAVAKGDLKLEAAAGASASQDVSVPVPADRVGPFYLRVEWKEAATGVSGVIHGQQGLGNARRRLEQFETVIWPEGHETFAIAPEAKRSERRGLRAALKQPEPAPRQQGPSVPSARFTLDRPLDGRPAKLGLWMRGDGKPVRLFAQIRDRMDNVQQRDVWDTWTIGPIAITAGDWQLVEIPVPEFGRPRSRTAAKELDDHESLLDYPLTLEWLRIDCDEPATVFIDDLTLIYHADAAGPDAAPTARVWNLSDKPSNVLYRNDRLDVAIANTDLSRDRELSYSITLETLLGAKIAEDAGSVKIPAGGDVLRGVTLQNAPKGACRLKVHVKEGDRIVYDNAAGKLAQSPDPADVFIIYEPTGQPMEPAKLCSFLSNKYAVLSDLGLNRDILLCAWHSVDGSPAVEPEPGYFTFDFLQEPLARRQAAGIEPVGRLGFTALWADPGRTFSLTWYGGTYVFPSKTIYWEEYVRRTVQGVGDRIKTWVVWDQPDSGALGAEPEEFLEKLLEPACKQIRKVQPDAAIISGAISRHNIEKFVQGMAEIGVGKLIDRIGLLPTTAPLSPEDGYLDVLLRRAQRIRAKERVAAPYAILDLSYNTGREGRESVSELDQAVYVPRAYVICRSVGIDDFQLDGGAPETTPSYRDSSELIYWAPPVAGNRYACYKPAALSSSFCLNFLRPAKFACEVFLNDAFYHKARAYLFQKDGATILVAWRQEGASTLHLPTGAKAIYDYAGNPGPAGHTVALTHAPVMAVFENTPPDRLQRELELARIDYDDEPQSHWKADWAWTLDVGNPDDEKQFNYAVEGGKLAGPVDSYYHNEYGQRTVDSGYHYTGSERFAVDVRPFADAHMIIRRRINYGLPDQVVEVLCDGQPVGRWLSFKRDRRNVWRDQEFIIPNRFFAGKERVELKFVAKSKKGATSYHYRIGPLKAGAVYLSDLSFLVGSSGYGPSVNRDANILGGTMSFHNPPSECRKGIGTNAADSVAESLVVVSLNRQFKRFKATVGVEAATGGRGSVRFRVGTGKESLFDSGDMTFYTETRQIDVDVSNADILMLMVTDTGDGRKDDVANWADARLELK